jgi:hypothetical protein
MVRNKNVQKNGSRVRYLPELQKLKIKTLKKITVNI